MKNENNKKRYIKLINIIFTYKIRILIAIICMILLAVTTAASAWMIKPILENIFIKKDIFMLNFLPIIILSIYALRGISMYGQEYHMDYIGQNLIKKLRSMIYAKITKSPYHALESKHIGILISGITYDVNIVKNMISAVIAGSIRDIFTITSLLIVIFHRDWKMASFAFFILPIALIPMIKFGKKIRKTSTKLQNLIAELNLFLHETFIGNKVIKAYNMENLEIKHFDKKMDNIFLMEMRNAIVKALSSPTMEFLGGLAVAFVIWYGGHQVIINNSEAGTFFSFIGAIIMLYDPVKKLTKINNSLQEGIAATHRIFNLIELESEYKSDHYSLYQIKKNINIIEFYNVSFTHNKKNILKNINFKIFPGENVAIVGKSGSGKTSIVNLILKFYNINNGKILINNINTNNISIKSLRKHISIVTQDPILFNNSIKNNIAYGKINATLSEIKYAAKLAYAYNFIKKYPKKFDTIIGNFGNKLSGGEKQRICIARAILKNSPILILDEATSSLDSLSETLIQKGLNNLISGRTTFIIAHRLSNIINADIILVMSNGIIIEKGKHKELLKNKGEYYKLYKSQFSNKISKKNINHNNK